MKRRAALLGLALCLALVGCAPLRGTRPIVKIGLVAPFEGRYRSLGYEVLYAVKWAVRQRNEAGGVAGHMIELVALDDRDDPETSAFQALKFAVDARVMGVIGPFSGVTVAAAAPVYHELKLAMITPATCSPQLVAAGDGEVFCLGAGVAILGRALVDRVPASAEVVLFRAQDGALGDSLLPSVHRVFTAPWDKAVLAELRARPGDVYLYDGDMLSAVDLATTLHHVGIESSLWGGPSLARSQLAQMVDGAVDGVCYALTAPLFADASPESAFGAGYRDLAGMAPGPWAPLAYDATHLLLDALEQAIAAGGRATRGGVIAQLSSVSGPDGLPAFVDGQRRQAETTFTCLETSDVSR